jgi:hypothetical protein
MTKVDNLDVKDAGSVHPLPEDHPPLHTLAGVMGLLNTDRNHLTAELGKSGHDAIILVGNILQLTTSYLPRWQATSSSSPELKNHTSLPTPSP